MKFLSLFFFATAAFASPATEPLAEQVRLMNEISPYVERVDMARLLVVRNSVGNVILDMENNVKSGKKEITFQTLRLIQNVIIQYRFSQVFFGWTDPRSITSIYTPQTEPQLTKLKKLSEDLATEYGYDDSPYTKITKNTFTQLKALLDQLETLPIDAALKDKLRALWMPIGETLAVADRGDRPTVFGKAIPVIRMIQALYPDFDKVSSSQAGFPMILELQGLTEFYAEYAEMEQKEGQ